MYTPTAFEQGGVHCCLVCAIKCITNGPVEANFALTGFYFKDILFEVERIKAYLLKH
jgi:hypothetical protein